MCYKNRTSSRATNRPNLIWSSLALWVLGNLVVQALLPVRVLLHIPAMHSQEWLCYKVLYALLVWKSFISSADGPYIPGNATSFNRR